MKYKQRKAFGVQVIRSDDINLEDILTKNDDILGCSRYMTLLGYQSIFVYIKSTYESSDTFPDSTSFRKTDTYAAEPILTQKEQDTMNEIMKSCECDPCRPLWITQVYMCYQS